MTLILCNFALSLIVALVVGSPAPKHYLIETKEDGGDILPDDTFHADPRLNSVNQAEMENLFEKLHKYDSFVKDALSQGVAVDPAIRDKIKKWLENPNVNHNDPGDDNDYHDCNDPGDDNDYHDCNPLIKTIMEKLELLGVTVDRAVIEKLVEKLTK